MMEHKATQHSEQSVIAGAVFGRLTVRKKNGRRWTVRCACGFCWSVNGNRLTDGSTTACRKCVADVARFERRGATFDERKP